MQHGVRYARVSALVAEPEVKILLPYCCGLVLVLNHCLIVARPFLSQVGKLKRMESHSTLPEVIRKSWTLLPGKLNQSPRIRQHHGSISPHLVLCHSLTPS